MIGHPHQWFGGQTYSQHGEDLILLCLFKQIGIARPSYLDIGAHHPFDISNTALFYERGSRGINVEANPHLIAAFRKYRPNDVNLNVGVGTEPGKGRFYLHSKRSGRNSFLRTEVEPLGIHSEMDVDVVTVMDIVDGHAGGVFPDILSIDVEGLDLAILKTVDYARGPKVVCMEVTKAAGNGQEAIDVMAGNGYSPCFRAGSNMIFLREEYRDWMTR